MPRLKGWSTRPPPPCRGDRPRVCLRGGNSNVSTRCPTFSHPSLVTVFVSFLLVLLSCIPTLLSFCLVLCFLLLHVSFAPFSSRLHGPIVSPQFLAVPFLFLCPSLVRLNGGVRKTMKGRTYFAMFLRRVHASSLRCCRCLFEVHNL